MKAGFTLIEVVVTLAISALMFTALYQALSQTSYFARRTDLGVDYGTLLVIMHNQLEKDISSAFYPLLRQGGVYPEQGRGEGHAAPVAPKKPVEPEKQKDEKFFVSERDKKGSTSFFTCITTNRLAVYGEDKPSLARVVYTFVPDKKGEQPGLFTLMRQESTKLDIKPFKDGKKIRSYTIAESLKKLKFKYLVFPIKEEKTQAQTLANAGPVAPERVPEKQERIESFDVWNEEIQKKTKRKMPDFVDIKGVFWDATKKREHPFNFRIPIIAQYQEQDEKPKEATPPLQVPEQQVAVQAPAQPQLAMQEPMTLNIVPKEQLALKLLPGENATVNLLPHQKITVSFMPDGGMEIRA